MKGLSIDIGVHNMAFYIEKFDVPRVINVGKLIKGKRYNPDGTLSEYFKNINEIYLNGETILLERVDLMKDNKGTDFCLEIFINLSNYLGSIKNLIDECDIVVIEQQLKTNPMAQRIEQHCVSWMTMMYQTSKVIVIYPARYKTMLLGAPKKINIGGKLKKMNKPERKKWCKNEAKKIIQIRNDHATLRKIEENKKADDLCDAICQFNSFKIRCFIDEKLK